METKKILSILLIFSVISVFSQNNPDSIAYFIKEKGQYEFKGMIYPVYDSSGREVERLQVGTNTGATKLTLTKYEQGKQVSLVTY